MVPARPAGGPESRASSVMGGRGGSDKVSAGGERGCPEEVRNPARAVVAVSPESRRIKADSDAVRKLLNIATFDLPMRCTPAMLAHPNDFKRDCQENSIKIHIFSIPILIKFTRFCETVNSYHRQHPLRYVLKEDKIPL